MSKLGDFLEVVYGPSDGFKTVRASIRESRNRKLAESARSGRPVMGRRKVQSDSAVQIDETHLQVWIELPDRSRIEKERRDGKRVRSDLTIVNGERSWECDDQGHVVESHEALKKHGRGVAGATRVDRYFSHASLREFFVSLSLEELGTVRTAGHDCTRLRAILRPGGSLWPHWLPSGADEYTFDVLPARGFVLAIQAFCDGELFETNEVTEVTFDEPIDSGLFTYTPAYGEQIRPPTPIVEHLSLEAAARRMPFTVLVPKDVPNADHAQLEVMYHPSRLPSTRPSLGLMYRWPGMELNLWLDEAATADPDLDEFEWEQIVRNGRTLRLSDPNVDGCYRYVAFEQSGTHVTIWSDIAREPLLDLAASLVPFSDV